MAHPQSSPRGLFAKQRIDVGSQQITTDSTGLVLNNGIKLSNARHLTANSTAYIGTGEAAIPTTDNGIAFTFVSNSTGVAIVVNSTGTTWKFLNVTSVQPT